MAIPLGAGLLSGWLVFGMSLGDLAVVTAVRTYAMALTAAIAIAIFRGARERRPARCVLALGGLAALVYGVIWAIWGFYGFIDIGQGEPTGRWTLVSAGPRAARPPDVELREVSPAGAARVAVAGREMEVARGRSYRASGMRIRILEQNVALRVVFRNEAGTTLEDALFKLPRDGPASDYIEIPILPHRFHFSSTRSGFPGAGGPDLKVPDALHIKVTRGKLTLLDRDLTKGEIVKVDQVAFEYLDGLPWARIELARDPGRFLLYAGIALLLTGAALELRARRATRRDRIESVPP